MDTVHNPQRDKPKCSLCGKSFSRRDALLVSKLLFQSCIPYSLVFPCFRDIGIALAENAAKFVAPGLAQKEFKPKKHIRCCTYRTHWVLIL